MVSSALTAATRVRRGSDVLWSALWRYKKVILLAVAALLLLAVFGRVVIPALVILLLGTAAAFSTSYKRIIKVPPALELVTFTTVLVSILFGPIVGAVYAAIATIASELMTNALDIFIVAFVPSRVVAALATGFVFNLTGNNVFLTGMLISVLYNALAQPFYFFVASEEMRFKAFAFVFLNIGFNFILFATIGRIVLTVLEAIV